MDDKKAYSMINTKGIEVVFSFSNFSGKRACLPYHAKKASLRNFYYYFTRNVFIINWISL